MYIFNIRYYSYRRSISIVHKEDANKPKYGNNSHQRLAAIFAASLISFGIVAFTITIIIAIVFYYKNVKERKQIQDVENGLTLSFRIPL